MKRSWNIDKLIRKFDIDTNSEINEVFLAKLLKVQAEHLKSLRLSKISDASQEHFLVRFPCLGWTCGFAAIFIAMIACLYSYILVGKVTDLKEELELARRDIAATPIDDPVTINFYLKEHKDFIARQASLNSAESQPIQMQIDQDDIMYYEFPDDRLEFMRPGIIVRGPSFQRQINSPETPVISNGYKLTLFEAREAANFDLVSPSWLDPGYKPDQIRIIEGRDAIQLLYTNGIKSISLFEQPLDGQRRLEPKDFREYAVYFNQEQAGGTILAWRDDTLSYVLIGNIEMSQLMDMAQSISAGK